MIPWLSLKSSIPHKSGVYIFKNSDKKIIYVGKAIDLYHRVASYFSSGQIPKTAALVSEIGSLETIVVESELEALILEANLIKKFLPIFNVRLTDDKDYLYIGLTSEDFPKVITARKQDLKKLKKYWGPFPSSRTVRDTLKLLRRVFPWCSSPPSVGNQKMRACFYFHLGLCPGACAGLISQEEYRQIIRNFSKFLDGKKKELVEDLTAQMMQASKQLRFEKAGVIKKMLSGINYMTQTNRVKAYLENPNFLEEENKLALVQLKGDLNLPKLPQRIECYDISNIQGKDATGSLVVLTNGDIDKSQYRKFKIQIAGRPNDVGMHKEMMRRRLKNNWSLPDLIIIDGGRGQVSGVWEELQKVGFNIPIFGLAKRMEWLYPPQGPIIKIPKRNLSLKLLQRLRDESHRFAINYYRKLHRKSVILS